MAVKHLVRLACVLFLLFATATPVAAAITYKQGNSSSPYDPISVVTTPFTAAQSVGGLNVVIVGWSDATNTIASVTDTKGNTYVRAVGPTTNAGNATTSLYYAKNIVAAAANGNSVTVTFSAAVNYPDIRIAEYAGVDTVAPLDVVVSATGTGTSMNSGSVTTTNANDLLVGGNYIEYGTNGVGSGYTQRVFTEGSQILEDRIVAATGSYSASATQYGSGWWIMEMAAFKAAGGGGGDVTAPTVPAGLTATPISSTQINLSWTASTDAVGVTGYQVDRCAGASCTTFAQIATPTTTSFNDTTVVASTTYRYQVRARDAVPNWSAYSIIENATTPAAPDIIAPTTPTGLTASPISATQVNLSWTASTDAVGVTGYQVDRCTGVSCTSFAQIATPTTTSFSDTTVVASTAYRYQVRARDAVPNWSAYSAIANATTPAAPDTTSPSTPAGLLATPTSSTQINLSWTASTDNVAVTGYLLERCVGASCSSFAQIASPVTTTYSDSSLTASTTYRYQVRATDAAGNLSAYSAIANATTSAAPDTTAPSVPVGLIATPTSSTQINLSWTASTDNVAVTGYLLERCQGSSCSSFAQIASQATTTYSDASLSASTTYRYQVRATDAAGNLSTYSSIAGATTPAAPDTTAPSVPAALIATPTSSTQINLSWTASTDNVAVTGYLLERCQGSSCSSFAQIASPATTTYSDPSLSASTTYRYQVRAMDAAGNLSVYSAIANATTSAAPDTTAPSIPAGLIATPASSGQINLSWTASTDNVAVTGYLLERCQGASCATFAQIAAPTTTNYSDAGLSASTTYRYQVRATDAAGNLGSYSTIVNAVTQAGGAASIAYVQSNSAAFYSTSAATATFSSAQSTSDLNVVIVGWSDATTNIVSITDSKGNAYLPAGTLTRVSGTATQAIYYAKNIVVASANSNTVTVTLSASAPYVDLRVAEYSGIDTSNPLDVVIGATGNGTGLNSGAVVTTNANDLLVAGNYIEHGTNAAGALFTQRLFSEFSEIIEDRIVSSTGSYSAGATQDGSGWWIMQMAAFKAAGGGGGGDVTAPTVPAGLTATPVSSTQINLSWAASTDAVGVTGYQVDRCAGASCTTFAQIATPTTTSFNDATVVASTAYRYQVRARDAVSNWSAYSTIANASTPAAPDTTAPSIPAGLIATPASSTQINLSWTSSTDNVAVTGYLLERCQGSNCSTFAQIASPTITNFSDSSLTASTIYRYQVRATDATGNLSAYSTIANATTSAAPDISAPSIPAGLIATPTSSTQINLSWTASTDNVAVTGYLLERCQGASCSTFAQVASPATSTYSDLSLTASTTYRYQVRATDAAGNLSAYSAIASATTSAAPDITAPSAPTGLSATTTSSTQINLSWTASTDNVAVTGYLLERCLGASCSAFAQVASLTTTSFSDTLLTASTTYRYQVRAIDGAGNLSAYSSIANATTSAAPDTSAPTVPTGLIAIPTSSTQINLSWTASTDDVAVTGYLLERCQGSNCSTFAQIASSTITTYSDASLTASTTYRYQVRATDSAGNLSAFSSISNATTQTGPDTTAPSTPTALIATPTSSTQINLSWTESTDNVAVTGYVVERCQGEGCTAFAQVASLVDTTYSDTLLTASTIYRYQVRATDAAGNLSAYSAIVNVTTSDVTDVLAPSVPTGLLATPASTSIDLTWTESIDDVGVTAYLLERCQGPECVDFELIATVATADFHDTGLTASTNYRYRVRATDAANNVSGYSNAQSATTLAMETTSYSTNFDLTQNPISEGNVWRRANNEWTNVRTANGIAHGTNGATNSYDDSYALLSGFGPDQRIDAVVERSPNLVTGITHEVELLLRFKDDAGNATGYECLFGYSGNIEIVRWNGPVGDFTPLDIIEGSGNLARDLDSGEVISATIVGNVISVYVNGELVARAVDSTFTSGQPGIGFFTRPGGDSANFGLTSFTASSNGAVPVDTLAPSMPTGLAASAVSTSQINLSWIASTDNVGVTGYLVERCVGVGCSNFVQVSGTSVPNFSDTTLTAATSYSYRVRATDAMTNLSAYSSTVNATTQATSPDPDPNPVAITYIQGNSSSLYNSDTASVPFQAAQTSGNLIVIAVGWLDAMSSVTSVSDSRGNTYSLAAAPTVSPGVATHAMYYAKNIASAGAGANVVTVRFSTSVLYPDVRVAEYSGLDTISPLDGSSSARGTGPTMDSGAFNTASANELLVGANFLESGNNGIGAGFTQRIFSDGSQILEDRIVAATGTYSASASQYGYSWWIMQMVAFKAASSGSNNITSPASVLSVTLAPQSLTQAMSNSSSANIAPIGGVESCQGSGCASSTQTIASTNTLGSNNGQGDSSSSISTLREMLYTNGFLKLELVHNSVASDAAMPNGVARIVKGWSFNYGMHVAVVNSSKISVSRPDGRVLEFQAPVSGNRYVSNADAADVVTQLLDAQRNLIGWEYTDAVTEYVETYDAEGNLTQVRARDGQKVEMLYSDANTPASIAQKAGLLICVTDNFDRQINFKYDNYNRLATVADPDGQQYRFAYDETTAVVLVGNLVFGNLTSITFPDTFSKQFQFDQ